LNKRDEIEDDVLKSMASKSLRTIALGYKDIPVEEFNRYI